MDSLYNPNFSTFQNQLQQLQAALGKPPTLPVTPPPRAIDFVNGEAGAREFCEEKMGPNSSAAVFDQNESRFFLLSKDANGKAAPLKRCPFTVEDVPEPGSDTLTKQDLDAFEEKIMGVLASALQKKKKEEPEE